MSRRIDYSSEDEASSDDGWSDWNEAAEQVELDEQEEDPAREHQAAVRMGRPKKRKAIVDPPAPIHLMPSQQPKKNGSRSELVLFEAYVPVPNLYDAFDLVMLRCTRNADGTPIFEEGLSELRFVEYFVQTWIGRSGGARPMFPNELWNCFESTKAGNAKTTNFLEAWHNALKLALGSSDGKKPKFCKWLRQMKKECSLKEAELVRLQSTPKKLKNVDKRIALQRKRLAEGYNPAEIFSYLRNQVDFADMAAVKKEELRAGFVHLRHQGLGYARIGQLFGVARQTVSKEPRRFGETGANKSRIGQGRMRSARHEEHLDGAPPQTARLTQAWLRRNTPGIINKDSFIVNRHSFLLL